MEISIQASREQSAQIVRGCHASQKTHAYEFPIGRFDTICTMRARRVQEPVPRHVLSSLLHVTGQAKNCYME